MSAIFEISENNDYGVIIVVNDVEIADEFDDFLNEDCYVFSEVKFEADKVIFYFGQAGSTEKARVLVEKFNMGKNRC
jgi:hypothetical protein